MTHQIKQSIKVNVSAEKIWQTLERYDSVENYAAKIKSSPIINDISHGVGAKRRCTFEDGSSLVEEIIEYQEGQGYTMALSEYAMPLKSMQASIQVNAIDADSCELSMSSSFVVKGGPLGWLMGKFLMAPMMKGVFKDVMLGLAYHTETGNRIDNKLPAQQELSSLVSS